MSEQAAFGVPARAPEQLSPPPAPSTLLTRLPAPSRFHLRGLPYPPSSTPATFSNHRRCPCSRPPAWRPSPESGRPRVGAAAPSPAGPVRPEVRERQSLWPLSLIGASLRCCRSTPPGLGKRAPEPRDSGWGERAGAEVTLPGRPQLHIRLRAAAPRPEPELVRRVAGAGAPSSPSPVRRREEEERGGPERKTCRFFPFAFN